MGMHTEARIHCAFAVVGLALTAYVIDKLFVLIQSPFVSIDAVVLGTLAIALGGLTVFYALLAFVFAVRFVDHIEKDRDLLALHVGNGQTIPVKGVVRIIRVTSREGKPRFALFIANGRIWVSRFEEVKDAV